MLLVLKNATNFSCYSRFLNIIIFFLFFLTNKHIHNNNINTKKGGCLNKRFVDLTNLHKKHFY